MAGKSDQVVFFDTTLRDGEQSPGVSLNPEEKLEIAEQLARLQVDVIEAGFPIASEGDFEGVRLIAEKLRGPVVCGLSRANKKDIECAARAVEKAQKPRIHTFISTSPTHLKYQIKKTPAQVLDITAKSVKLAKKYVDDVEFSAMDATRSDPAYLVKVFNAAIEAGATTINVPDTVGYALPEEYGALIAQMIRKVKGSKNVIWSVHCHDDLGFAVANSVAAVAKGARQVEVAVNGIGERAGNAALEEVAMTLYTRRDLLGLGTGLNLKQIGDTSRIVSKLTGYTIPRNKAVVGANAFQHESGIHQDGVLKERSTYEIMKSDTIGLRAEQIVLGKHSGRHAFSAKLEELGLYLEGDALDRAFKKFKDLADARKKVTFQEIEAITLAEIGRVTTQYQLVTYQSFTGTDMIPVAAVRMEKNGRTSEATSKGDGQVDALCRAIAAATKFKGKLTSYRVEATTEGLDSLGEVMVSVEDGDMKMTGRGIATDVIEASARAYLNAINRLYQKRAKENEVSPAKKKTTRKGPSRG